MVRRIWLHVISAMSGITHLVKVFQQKSSQIPRSHGCVASAFRYTAVVCPVFCYITTRQCSSSEISFSVNQLYASHDVPVWFICTCLLRFNAHRGLVLQVYLGSNTLEFSAIHRLVGLGNKAHCYLAIRSEVYSQGRSQTSIVHRKTRLYLFIPTRYVHNISLNDFIRIYWTCDVTCRRKNRFVSRCGGVTVV